MPWIPRDFPVLRREIGKTFGNKTLSTPERDSNLNLPAIGGKVHCESSGIDHAATELIIAEQYNDYDYSHEDVFLYELRPSLEIVYELRPNLEIVYELRPNLEIVYELRHNLEIVYELRPSLEIVYELWPNLEIVYELRPTHLNQIAEAIIIHFRKEFSI
uniref:Uncharacterized protein n=1 Tax=Timema bartmani TaxID=61472 RepID=A0A7R9F5C4_9NEOP|nr:unnamed protein product [Timema bartmani]